MRWTASRRRICPHLIRLGVRALATFFFLWLTAEPLLQKLDRIKTKYGLAE